MGVGMASSYACYALLPVMVKSIPDLQNTSLALTRVSTKVRSAPLLLNSVRHSGRCGVRRWEIGKVLVLQDSGRRAGQPNVLEVGHAIEGDRMLWPLKQRLRGSPLSLDLGPPRWSIRGIPLFTVLSVKH